MMVWELDLQLTVQIVPITTSIVNLNPAHGEVCSIQLTVIKFVSDCHDITEILLKVTLKITIPTPRSNFAKYATDTFH
jgi:hypothetical protein